MRLGQHVLHRWKNLQIYHSGRFLYFLVTWGSFIKGGCLAQVSYACSENKARWVLLLWLICKDLFNGHIKNWMSTLANPIEDHEKSSFLFLKGRDKNISWILQVTRRKLVHSNHPLQLMAKKCMNKSCCLPAEESLVADLGDLITKNLRLTTWMLLFMQSLIMSYNEQVATDGWNWQVFS